MANIVMNIAKGRVKEYYARVEGNDPANSAIIPLTLFDFAITPDGSDVHAHGH